MKSNHIVEILVQLKDRAIDPMRRLSQQSNNLKKDLSGAGTSLGAFSNNMGILEKRLDRIANSMYRFNMYSNQLNRTLRDTAAVGALAAGALAVNSTNKAIDFEYKMHKMQTRMEVGDNVRKDISEYIANELNSQVAFGPSELGDIGIILGQGGINSAPDMIAMLKTSSYFAEAVDAVPEQAAEMIISAAKGFDISMTDSVQITDKLTVALNKSLLHTEELPHAIGELAGRAKMFGQSFDSSLTALMSMRDQGMSAAQGSQDLLHGLRQLSLIGRDDVLMPRRREYYEKLGVDTSFFDIEKKQLKEWPEIIESLEKTMRNKGMMKDKDTFYKMIDDNGGKIPDGVINKMESMPLISRVFGAAGQAPLIMGLQTKYEEVDEQTGQKTGEVFYGSDALKRMRTDLLQSQGAVDKVHAKMAETAHFQLDVLSGTWEAAQIKMVDDMLPLIKAATQELTAYISGKGAAGGIERFNKAVENTANNLRKTNPMLGDFVETSGKFVSGAAQVTTTMAKPLFGEIGDAVNNNIAKAEWGDSLLTLPYYATKNGFGFLQDMYDNSRSNAAIESLPPELQNEATLTRNLIKGGLALMAASAIIKVLEYTFRLLSMSVKGIKGTAELGKAITTLFSKSMTDAAKKGALTKAMDSMKKNYAINANVVNVYGKNITGGPNGKNGGGVYTGTSGGGKTTVAGTGGGLPPRSQTHGKGGTAVGAGRGLIGGLLGLAGTYLFTETASAISDNWKELTKNSPPIRDRKLMMSPEMQKYYEEKNPTPKAEDAFKNKNSLMHAKSIAEYYGIDEPYVRMDKNSGKIAKELEENRKDPLATQKKSLDGNGNFNITSFISEIKNMSSGIFNSIDGIRKNIENIQVQNKINIQLNPNVNISGQIKSQMQDVQVSMNNLNSQNAIMDTYKAFQNKRLPGRG